MTIPKWSELGGIVWHVTDTFPTSDCVSGGMCDILYPEQLETVGISSR